ncbi:hypothetical protein BDV93DRAFT_604383 [Ceratobasidium sp. AG-I]|nr:hypothetical protein BDV93DRAFT_604383 [Ceratobasidium sp. AG-I]
MDSNKSVLRAFDPLANETRIGKENTLQNLALFTPAPKLSSTKFHALTTSALSNHVVNPLRRLQKPDGNLLIDFGYEEEKSVATHQALSPYFGEGVRRESFPGKHTQTPDISLNFERIVEGTFIGDGSYIGDHPRADQLKGTDVVFADGVSPVASSPNTTPSAPISNLDPETSQPHTLRMIAPSISYTEPDSESFPFASPARASVVGESPVTAFKARTVPTRSPLAFQIGGEEVVRAEVGSEDRRDARNKASPKQKLDLGRGFEFALPEREELGTQRMQRGGPSPMRVDAYSLASRAATLQFLVSDQSQAMTEMDSILDVQLPEDRDEDATTSYGTLQRQVAHERQQPEPRTGHRRQESAPSYQRQESAPILQRQASEYTHRRQESAPSYGQTLSVPSRARHELAYPGRPMGTANDTLPEDEPTLNIAALGLSEFSNTLLVDMSLDQLKPKPGVAEMGDGTFSRPSFVEPDPGPSDVRKREFLDAKTPKPTRTASNPIPDLDDMDVDVEATVKKPRLNKTRVVSEAMVDALRSGRALQRTLSTVPHARDVIGEQSLSKGSSASGLSHHRTDSTPSLRRTDSATSLYRTSSTTSHRTNSTRRDSRASSVAMADDELETEGPIPYGRPPSALSRAPSQQSLVYAPPSHGSSQIGWSPSATSFNEQEIELPVSRPMSSASIQSTSTRPTTAASDGPISTTLQRSGSITSTHRRVNSEKDPMDALCNDLAACMKDDLEEYMRSDDDAYIPAPRPTPATVLEGFPGVTGRPVHASIAPEPACGLRKDTRLIGRDAAAIGARESNPRLRPKSSTTSISGAEAGSKGMTRDSAGVRVSGMTAPRSLSSKSSGLGLSAKSSSSTLGARASSTRSTTLGPSASRLPPVSSTARSLSGGTAAGLTSKPSSGTLRTRSNMAPPPAPSSNALRATRSTTTMEPPRSLRPRTSAQGLFAANGGPGEEPPRQLTRKGSSGSLSTAASATSTRSLRPTSSSIASRGASASSVARSGSGSGVASETTSAASSRAPSLSRATAGSIASLREAAKSRGTLSRR